MKVSRIIQKSVNFTKKKLNKWSSGLWFTILLFFGLQIILFLPFYFFHLDNGHFFPLLGDPPRPEHPWLTNNHNPFRLLGEWLVMVTILLAVVNLPFIINKTIRLIGFVLFPLILAYHVYLQFSFKVYGIHPSIPDDYISIREVLPIFLRSIDLWNIPVFLLTFLIFSIILFLLEWVFFWFIKSLQLHYKKRGMLIFIWLLWVIVLLGTNQTRQFSSLDNRLYVQWVTPKIYKSLQIENLFSGKYGKIKKHYGQYQNCPLERKPNVYLIFPESYGAIAYLDKEIGQSVSEVAKLNDERLKEAGWHAVSAYSDSPIKGGRSWLAFTTGLTGANIRNQMSYNFLMDAPFNYPHMVSFFNTNNYYTTWISTMQMKANLEDLISEEELNSFWQYDTLLFYNRIPYNGPKFNNFGGLPDQYAIEYYQDKIVRSVDAPHFVFFITTSTHSPFYPPPPILKNWQEFDHWKPEKTRQLTQLKGRYIDRYGDAMKYTIEYWIHFITQKGGDNDLFILVGDHQPPGLDWKLYNRFSTWATPVHIISKNEALVNRFLSNDFQQGFWIDPEKGVALTHAGLYSIFMKHFLATYGLSSCQEFPVLKEGIN